MTVDTIFLLARLSRYTACTLYTRYVRRISYGGAYQWRKEKIDIRIGGSEAVLWGRSAVDQIRKREMYGKKKGKKGWSSGNRWKVYDEGGECAFIGMRSDEFPLGHFINAEPTKLSIAKPLPRQTLSTTSRFSSINAKALEPSIPPASIRAPALHTTSRKFDSRHDRLTPRLSIMHTRMRGT